MISSRTRFVVVGCGNIGKKHVEMIAANPHAELAAIVDIKDKGDLPINIGETPYFNSLEDFLNSEIKADVVNIATPNYLHTQQAVACLQKGFHVVLEKPIALSTKDANLLIQEELKSGKKIFVVMQNRYSPLSKWIKELVDSEKLGEIFMVQVNCFWNRDNRYYQKGGWRGDLVKDGGTLFTQYSHFLDVMYWLFGDVDNIQGKFFNNNHQDTIDFEDSGIVTFDFKNGGTGILNFSTSVFAQNMESSLTIIAENGSVKISGQYMDKLEFCSIKDYECPQLEAPQPSNDYGTYKGSASNHQYVIQNVVDVLQNGGLISVDTNEGFHVIDLIERFYKQRDLTTLKNNSIDGNRRSILEKTN